MVNIKEDSQDMTPLAKLIHDFNCRKADDMYSSILADRLRYFKEDEKGRKEMCKVIEDLMNEEKREIAKEMLEDGVSFEKIARYLKTTPEKIKELVEEQGVLV